MQFTAATTTTTTATATTKLFSFKSRYDSAEVEVKLELRFWLKSLYLSAIAKMKKYSTRFNDMNFTLCFKSGDFKF